MMKNGDEVTFGGTRFRVEVTPCSQSAVGYYTKLHPLDDPDWMLRVLEVAAPRETPQSGV
jgi:hypothetical protein